MEPTEEAIKQSSLFRFYNLEQVIYKLNVTSPKFNLKSPTLQPISAILNKGASSPKLSTHFLIVLATN